jgi:thiol-disulfide isomerase/thioredoxin
MSKPYLHSRRSIIAAATGLAASALAGNRAVAQADDSGLPDAADSLAPMQPVAAPDLKFTNAKGRSLSLADYAGHVLVVNLWATWCGPCVAEIPSFAALAGQIQPFGGLILPISIDANGVQAVRPFYELHMITDLPVLLDPDGNNLDVLNTDGVPVTIIINREGRLAGRVDGASNWNTPRVRAFLRSLVSAQPPAKPDHIMAL